MSTIRLTRERAGFYRYEGTRYTHSIARVISEYGDVQWSIDSKSHERDNMTEYYQTETLAAARATIAAMEREVTA